MDDSNRARLYRMTFLSGALSICSYILLFTHQEWVTRNFTRGGVYAALPIATAFYFSLVHGTFTSCVLHSLGFRIARKAAPVQAPAGDSLEGEVQQ